MELYILDAALRRTAVVDSYISMIWTERFDEVGDFQLVMESNKKNRALFAPGVQLASNVSMCIMTCETAEAKVNADGERVLTIKGRSLEQILDDRLAKSPNGVVDPWYIEGTPGNVCRWTFETICLNGQINIHDKIPWLLPGTYYQPGSIPEPAQVLQWALPIKSLLATIQEICKTFQMGFRLVRNFDTSQLYFEVYMGDDRTTNQQVRPAVVFAPELDNLQNTTEYLSARDLKNVAYVVSDTTLKVVYAPNYDPLSDGFDRKVLFVDAHDVTAQTVADAGSTVDAVLTQKGLEALALHQAYSAFDGELDQNGAYTYLVDYFLGDLVDVKNTDGATSSMQVTEQIFISDSEGERSYPTLTLNMFIDAGSWLGYKQRKWADIGLTEFWANSGS